MNETITRDDVIELINIIDDLAYRTMPGEEYWKLYKRIKKIWWHNVLPRL